MVAKDRKSILRLGVQSKKVNHAIFRNFETEMRLLSGRGACRLDHLAGSYCIIIREMDENE